jgi:hypothetical protein
MIIPAHPRIVFTPAKALRERVSPPAPQPQSRPPGELPAPAPESVELPSPQPEQVEAVIASITEDETSHAPGSRRSLFTGLAAMLILASLGLGIFYLPDDNQAMLATASDPGASENTVAVQPTPASEIAIAAVKPEPLPQASSALPAMENNTLADTHTTTNGHSTETAPYFPQRSHRLKNGDSLWRLSGSHYLNPFYWPHIYRVNEDKISNPNRLLIGKTILLPELQGRPGQLTEADKRNIAEGYFRVYLYYKEHNRPFPYYALLGVHKFDPSVLDSHRHLIDEQDRHDLQLASN